MTIPIIENIKMMFRRVFPFFFAGGGGRLFFYLVNVKNDWGSLAF